MKLRIALILLVMCSPVTKAATINVACDFLSISNALMSTAAEGDTVIIGSGSCVISNQLVLNRGISFNIQGSGTNSTTLISSGTVIGTGIIAIKSNSVNQMTISDMNCIGADAERGFFQSGWNWGNVSGPALHGMVRFTRLTMTNIMQTGLVIAYSDSRTLVDHCTFIAVNAAGGWNCLQTFGNFYFSWTSNNFFGTTNMNYVEDCYFKNNSGNVGNGFYDSYAGGSVCFRHCFFDGDAASGAHGYDSGYTSFRELEIYNCIHTNCNDHLTGTRGGGFLFYSNHIYSTYNSSHGSTNGAVPQFQYYRAIWANSLNTQTKLTFPGEQMTNGLAVNPSDGQTFGAGFSTYTFKNSVSTTGGQVKIGSTLQETISNLFNCINGLSGAGTQFGSISTNAYPGDARSPNNDLIMAWDGSSTNFYFTNRMDGNTDQYGYPCAMQPGMVSMHWNSNTGVVMYPQYQWSNLLTFADGVVSNIFWVDSFAALTNRPNNTTNVVLKNRDYFNDTLATNYSPYIYPHPLNVSGGGGSAVLSAVPTSLNFGTILTNTSLSLTFYVTNSGTAILDSGSASTSAPFSVSNADYSGLVTNAAQTITVTFTPTSSGSFSGTVTCTGGGGATVSLSGSATNAPFFGVMTKISGNTTISGATVIK